MKNFLATILCFSLLLNLFAQDEIKYKERTNGFYQDSILPSIDSFESKQEKSGDKRYLSMDFGTADFPTNLGDYEQLWHQSPLSQGATGTCWCYATISFLESEVYRISGQEVKLSEMYVVYWEYVARARYFVEHRGDMYFGQGSESNAVIRNIKSHGLVPAGQYSGMKEGQTFHNHGPMAKEIKEYLGFVKNNNIWDEETVVNNVRSILDHYMGAPPQKVSVKSDLYSPKDYMTDVLKINPDDYYSFMSTLSLPYNQMGELVEPDNWWHNKEYYNIALSDFHDLLIEALDAGYTLSLCGDVSEPGYDRYEEVGIVPSFDIPEDYINEHAREFRTNNGSTTDDHCVHIVGYTQKDGKNWYLLKDSSSSGFDGPNRGYRFIREDYVKLKVLALLTHKYAARDVLDKIIK